jgi:Trk-type K+ transport system membrane component
MPKLLPNQKEAILVAVNVLLLIVLLAVALASIGSLGKSLVRAFEASSTDGTAGISFDFTGFKALNLQIR